MQNATYILIWILFMAASVYGHVALKFATNSTKNPSLVNIVFSPWGITCIASWALCGLLWIFILSKHPLLTANSISALRYVLIAFASWYFFKDVLSAEKIVGVVLIMAGIYFVTHGTT